MTAASDKFIFTRLTNAGMIILLRIFIAIIHNFCETPAASFHIYDELTLLQAPQPLLPLTLVPSILNDQSTVGRGLQDD